MISFEYERDNILFDINTEPKKLIGNVASINSLCNSAKTTVSTEAIKIIMKKTKNNILLVLLAWLNSFVSFSLFIIAYLIYSLVVLANFLKLNHKFLIMGDATCV